MAVANYQTYRRKIQEKFLEDSSRPWQCVTYDQNSLKGQRLKSPTIQMKNQGRVVVVPIAYVTHRQMSALSNENVAGNFSCYAGGGKF